MPDPAQSTEPVPISIPPSTPVQIGSSSSDSFAPAATSVPEMNPQDIASVADALASSVAHLSVSETAAPVSVGAVPAGPTATAVPENSAGMPDTTAAVTPPPPASQAAPLIGGRPVVAPDPASASTAPPTYGSLLEVLVAQGVLEQELANKLQVDQITTGKTLETLVTENNVVSEEELARAKATFNNIPFIKLSEVGVFPEAINQLAEGAARHYAILPFAYDKAEGTLSVAMKDPLDLSAIDFAQQKTGLRILAYYAVPSEVERMVAEYYSQTLSSEVTAALEQTTQMAEAQAKKGNLADLSKETIRQAPITKIVETLVSFAIKARASDIHVEPMEDRTRVRYRIDGILMEKLILPKNVHEAVVSRIKILSGLKIDEKRLPQDGRFNFATQEQEVDLRVSTLPTINGEKVVMRLLKKDATVPTLVELGLNGLALRNVEDAIKVPHGIVLITGPTGSGKTTTLYSILHKINTPKVNIMTLEDPVEYQMLGVNQVQINPQAGLTFASGLRSFLRQDPNIIMVGEIRDSETAELAIQASLTGHLVFSTLHTSSAAGALPRLMDMGAEPFLLASSMTCVMAQRVLRKLHPDYIEQYIPDKAVVDDIKKVLGDKFEPWCKRNNKDPENITLVRSSKNRPDSEPEYKGRVAIFEVMKITEEIARLILERKPASDMEKLALRDGMLFMKQDGYFKALEGVTTIEEVLRVAQI
jgi:type IV pilus assembly protein PilB